MKAKTDNTSTDTGRPSMPLSRQNEQQSFFDSSEKYKNSFFKPGTLQPKLKIGQPNNEYEREADGVADQVMRMPDPQVQRQPMEEEELQMKLLEPGIQRKCTECEEGEKLQKKVEVKTLGSGRYFAGQQISNRIKSHAGNGNSIPGSLQSEMGSKMGADFSRVNIHTDANSHKLSQQLGAKAFTQGNDIYFNRGEYNPGSSRGKHLLAHELTHVVQQADRNSKLVQHSRRIEQALSSPLILQRDVLTGEEAFEEVNRDRIYEYFAHDIGYMDDIPLETQEHVGRLGFSVGPIISGRFGLKLRVFTPNEEAINRGHIPIIVFRGTELDLRDIFDDLNSAGVGMRQFNINSRLIENIMDQAGRSDVTGHSLGGALAQVAAATYHEKVRRVVTFQAPGIPVSVLHRLRGDDQIDATHYRAAHDIVDDVGEGSIAGTVYEIDFDAISNSESEYEVGELMGGVVSAHTSAPIDRLRDIRGQSESLLTRVRVTRHQTLQPNRNRLIETFRREVLGIEYPQDYSELTPDEMLERYSAVRGELRNRMNSWMLTYQARINELDQNLIFILLEIIDMIYEGGEEIDMWQWVLNSSPQTFREALHGRLIAYINPNNFDTAPGMQRRQYQRILNYNLSLGEAGSDND